LLSAISICSADSFFLLIFCVDYIFVLISWLIFDCFILAVDTSYLKYVGCFFLTSYYNTRLTLRIDWFSLNRVILLCSSILFSVMFPFCDVFKLLRLLKIDTICVWSTSRSAGAAYWSIGRSRRRKRDSNTNSIYL
jgi:hypothetical protein